MIEVSNLYKSFGKLSVLSGINETIKYGEIIFIVGPSGSGKSTFLRCLNLLEQPTSGSIEFDGIKITEPKVNIDEIRANMGMVFQNFNLFPHMNVLNNIILAPVTLGRLKKEEAEEKATELLKRIGLEDKKYAFPRTLSGGNNSVLLLSGLLRCPPR